MGHSINVLVLGEANAMMKKIFISIPNQLFILIIPILLCISLVFSITSINRSQNELTRFQLNTLIQAQLQLDVQSDISVSKLRDWLESFAEMTEVSKQENFDSLSQGLRQYFDELQLKLNVENIWLLNAQLQPLYTTTELSGYVIKNATKALTTQRPQNRLYCLGICQYLVSMPLMNKNGELAIVSISISLVDMLYAMKSTLKQEVAIISFDDSPLANLESSLIISTSNSSLFNHIFKALSGVLLVNEVRREGIEVEFTSSNYLLNLLPLTSDDRQYYLATADDITSFKIANNDYNQQFLAWVVSFFIVLSILVYWLINPYKQRLLILANALHLLTKKEFYKFRQLKLQYASGFFDELDILTDRTIALGEELEKLNVAVNQKTTALKTMAMFDRLTGLPNRNMLNESLCQFIALRPTVDKKGIAVLFLDLDDFKKVNDSYGHTEGDQLLIVATKRLRLNIKKTDFICRFGGDEFVIVLTQLESLSEAKAVAKQILLQFKEPIKLPYSDFYVTPSIGIVFSEEGNDNADHLISYADIAMYQAKDNGGNQYHVYHEEMYQQITKRVGLEVEIRQALSKKQFSLSFQPQINPKNNKFYGFEALLRWHHPERGIIPPDDFVSLLENSPHLIIVGYWVIRRCFELCIDMQAHGLSSARISINLSSGQFNDPHLISYFQELLIEFELDAKHFELEITEQTIVKDIKKTIKIMDALKSIGFTFAIDEFGSGYSSLSYLKKLPVDVIKIDKSLVLSMEENYVDYHIIISTIDMVRKLGLTVIACGVETTAQLDSLIQSNCDFIQGDYFFKAIPEGQIPYFIDQYISKGYYEKLVES